MTLMQICHIPLGLKMGDCKGEAGLPGSDSEGLGPGIMRGDNDIVEGAVDRDQVRSPMLVRQRLAEEPALCWQDVCGG
jgi:hypothetical protein